MADAPQKRPPIQVFKTLVGVLLVGSVLALVVLYQLGKRSTPEPQRLEERDVEASEGLFSGEVVEQVITHEGRPLLRLKGQSDSQDSLGRMSIRGAEVTFYRESEGAYTIQGDLLVFDMESKAGQLTGNVKASTPDGATLLTDELIVSRGARSVESTKSVAFTFPAERMLVGKARKLRIDLRRDTYVLAGDVVVQSEPNANEEPLELNASLIAYEQDRGLLRADGEVTLRMGESWVRAQRVALHLSESRKKAGYLRAQHQLEAVLMIATESGGVDRLQVSGESLHALLEEDGLKPIRMELNGWSDARAIAIHEGEWGQRTRYLAQVIVGHFRDGKPTTLTLEGRTEVSELMGSMESPVAVRRACAAQAELRFTADGEPGVATLTGGVDLHEPWMQIKGEELRLNFLSEEADMRGAPASILRVQGRVDAPRLVYREAMQLLRAEDGVRAEIQQGGGTKLEATPLGGGAGPILVTAQESIWQQAAGSFVFLHEVRAWQGGNLLLADQLRGEPENSTVTASGSVETTWVPREGDSGPIEVSSNTVAYRGDESLLEYEGDVVARQGGRNLSCQRLTALLSEANQIHRMICRDEVFLEDPVQNRTVHSDEADYDVAAEEVVFKGDPVRVTDGEGGTISGKMMIYRFPDGTVNALSPKQVDALLEEEAQTGEGSE